MVIINCHGVIAVEVLRCISVGIDLLPQGSVIRPVHSLISELRLYVEATFLADETSTGIFDLRANESFASLVTRHSVVFQSLNFLLKRLIIQDLALLIGHFLR